MMKKQANKGNASIVLCILITAIFGFAAFALDIGLVYTEKIKLSNAMDAAALAAVVELPNDEVKARSTAEEYLKKNGVDSNNATITIGDDKKSIQVYGTVNVKHLFAPIIGIQSSNVSTSSKAIVAPAKSIKGSIRPFAVENYSFSYGDLVTLKSGAGSGYHGNYGAVALGGTGNSVFRNNALYGYNGNISVGDYIDTEPGNMAGTANAIKNYINSESSSFDNFSRSSIRIWTIPIVDSLAENGRKQVQVVGFAEFYVENIYGKSGKIEINGRFIQYVVNAPVDTNLNDTGLYGARLSK